MDYAILPKNRVREHYEIPLLATEDYDDGDAAGYPNRQGWGERTVHEWNGLFYNPPPEFLAFLQTWLYFGAIAIIFGRHVSITEFSKPGKDGKRVLDGNVVRTWLRLYPLREVESESMAMSRRSVSDVILGVHTSMQVPHNKSVEHYRKFSLMAYVSMLCNTDPRDPLSVQAITLLLEVLLEYYCCHGRLAPGQIPFTLWGARGISSPYHSILYKEMRRDGWCPSDLRTFFRRTNTASIYFMRSVERPHSKRQHKMIKIKSNAPKQVENDGEAMLIPNVLCTKKRCGFLQLNDEDYRTRHADDCNKSGCYELTADPKEVLDILKSGSIPLILSLDEHCEESTLMLVPSGPDFNYSYVAISHVWSDGLGNVQRSALPICQVRRLSRMVRNLPGKSSGILLFWIDTIGCPPDVAGENEAQELAISMMRQTYERAAAVLVLDSWLLTREVAPLPDHEVLMSIISSSWNGRLWTLQEGALAQRLYFQFADRAYDMDDGLLRLHRSRDEILRSTLLPTIAERVHEIRGFARAPALAWRKLNYLRAALSMRSTSVATDEALCLGVLLDFPKDKFMKIIEADPKDRMRTFWSLWDEVPRAILFDNYPCLPIEGFRWAPESFLGPQFNPHLDASNIFETEESRSQGVVKRTEYGVEFTSAGMVWSTEGYLMGDDFFLIDAHQRVYRIRCDLQQLGDIVQRTDVSHLYDRSELQNPNRFADGHAWLQALNVQEHFGGTQVCLIIDDDTDRVGNDKDGPSCKGIFASVHMLFHGVLHVRRICTGSCRTLRVGVDDDMINGIRKIAKLGPPQPDDDGPGGFTLPMGAAVNRDNMIVKFAGTKVFNRQMKWRLT